MAKSYDEILQPPDKTSRLLSTLKRGLSKLPLLVCVGLFLFHFSVIRKYAVNLPNWDEWLLFAGDSHPASVDLAWLYAQHNEHRTSTTKTFVWLQFQLNGWNVRTHLLIDFIIYGFFLALLVCFARRIAPQVPTWIVLAFVIFFLSPIIWLEHFMAYPVAVHFWVIFFFISAYFLFSELQKWPSLLIGILSSILSIYSFAAGFVTSLILLLAFWIFKGLRAHQATGKKDRTREILQLLLVTLLVGGALIAWIIGYQKPANHPPLTFPYHLAFWRFFLNLISFGFGIDQLSVFWGLICLLVILAPICGEVWKRRGRLSSAHWAAVATVFAILANLASISMGRAGFGVEYSKIQEYAEHGMPLMILSVLNWSIFFKDRKILKAISICALWIFFFFTFQDNWNFDIYRTESARRLEGVRCIKAYYDQVGDGRCPTIFPTYTYLTPYLDQGKRLNASFYQEIVAESRQKPGSASNASDYVGAHDMADCQRIAGWAWNRAQPYKAISVDIYDGETLLATESAISVRADVSLASYASGYCGFDLSTPSALKDGRTHTIRVKFAGTSLDLANTPKSLVCASP